MKNDLFCKRTIWRNREAYKLGNGLIELMTLMGGGHVAEFHFAQASGLPSLNPLWIPPWRTIEPYRYREDLHVSQYGSLTEGKLLSGLVGHNVCVDYFGSPSPEEARQGLSQHGEAASAKWRKTNLRVSLTNVVLTLSVKLPVAGLRFSREISLRPGESVAYFTETVVNESKCDHFFHWTQHVTLGPPFVSHRDSAVSIPGNRGLTFPHGYDEGRALLDSNRRFRWPRAPRLGSGQTVDLRRTLLERGLGFVASVLIDTRRKLGFIAALNAKEQLAIGYCFHRADYPWVAVWEENQAIAAPPWKRKTQARGLEFGTTPIPLPRREAFATGTLFGVPTFTFVPARGRKTIRYAAFLAKLPPSFRHLRDIETGKTELRLLGNKRHDSLRIRASGLSAWESV